MKLIAALLALCPLAASATSPVAGPVFTHFHDYNPRTKAYTAKSYSQLGRAQSAELLVNGTTGLCWAGQPQNADLLVEQMIDVYNNEPAHRGAELSLTYFRRREGAKPGRPLLQFAIGQQTPDGVAQIEWDQVRPCR